MSILDVAYLVEMERLELQLLALGWEKQRIYALSQEAETIARTSLLTVQDVVRGAIWCASFGEVWRATKTS